MKKPTLQELVKDCDCGLPDDLVPIVTRVVMVGLIMRACKVKFDWYHTMDGLDREAHLRLGTTRKKIENRIQGLCPSVDVYLDMMTKELRERFK